MNSKLSKTSHSSKRPQSSTRRFSNSQGFSSFAENGGYSSNQRSCKYVNEEELQQQIEIAKDELKLYVELGALLEAGATKRRLSALKIEQQIVRQVNTKREQNMDMRKVDQEHKKKVTGLKIYWDTKIRRLRQEFEILEKELVYKHQEEMIAFLKRLQVSLPYRPKESPELLNYRKIQQTLINQQEYIEAYYVKEKCAEMEKEELQRWVPIRNKKIFLQKEQLEKKQILEWNNLQKRMVSIQLEQDKARYAEFERLQLNYQNLKKEQTTKNQNNINRMTPRSHMSNMNMTGGFFSVKSAKSQYSSVKSPASFMSIPKNWRP